MRIQVSQRGATVRLGHRYSPCLTDTEMASLESEMATGTEGLTRQDSELVTTWLALGNTESYCYYLWLFSYLNLFCLSSNIWSYRHATSKSVVRIYQCVLTFQPQLNWQIYSALRIPKPLYVKVDENLQIVLPYLSFRFIRHQCMNEEPFSVWPFHSQAKLEMVKVYE